MLPMDVSNIRRDRRRLSDFPAGGEGNIEELELHLCSFTRDDRIRLGGNVLANISPGQRRELERWALHKSPAQLPKGYIEYFAFYAVAHAARRRAGTIDDKTVLNLVEEITSRGCGKGIILPARRDD